MKLTQDVKKFLDIPMTLVDKIIAAKEEDIPDQCMYCNKVVWLWQRKSYSIDKKGNLRKLYHLKCKSN